MFAQHNKFGITLQVDKKFLNYHNKTTETVEKCVEKTESPEAAARAARMAAAAKEQAKAKQAAAAKAKAKVKAMASEKEERCLLAEAVKAAKAAVELVEAAKSKPMKPEPEPAKKQDGAARAAKSEAAKAEAAKLKAEATGAEPARLGAEAARPLVQARSSSAGPAIYMQRRTRHACSHVPCRRALPSQVQVELKKGQTIMVDANLHQPSGALHEDVSERSGLPADTFELYHRSKRLEGEAVLASWGIEKDSLIEVKTRGRGGKHGSGGGGGDVDGGGSVEGGGGETDSCLGGVGSIGGVEGVGSGSSSGIGGCGFGGVGSGSGVGGADSGIGIAGGGVGGGGDAEGGNAGQESTRSQDGKRPQNPEGKPLSLSKVHAEKQWLQNVAQLSDFSKEMNMSVREVGANILVCPPALDVESYTGTVERITKILSKRPKDGTIALRLTSMVTADASPLPRTPEALLNWEKSLGLMQQACRLYSTCTCSLAACRNHTGHRAYRPRSSSSPSSTARWTTSCSRSPWPVMCAWARRMPCTSRGSGAQPPRCFRLGGLPHSHTTLAPCARCSFSSAHAPPPRPS